MNKFSRTRSKSNHNSGVSLSVWCTRINFSILDLKNPGPRNNNDISVFYQNVQGLIPFSQLGNPNPMLDHTKIMELHAFMSKNQT